MAQPYDWEAACARRRREIAQYEVAIMRIDLAMCERYAADEVRATAPATEAAL